MTTSITDVQLTNDRSTTSHPAAGHRYAYAARSASAAGRRTYTAHLNPERRIVAAEPDFSRRFGRTSADTCGRSLYELLHPSSPSYLDRHFTRLSEGRCNRFDERMIGLGDSGRVFSAGLTGIAVHDTTGGLAGIVVQVRPDQEGAAAEEPAVHSPERLLSKLDAQVLEGVAAGASTVQLAARLYLSRQGVEYHVGLMLRKLKAPNRAALVARAHSLGMLTVGHWPPRVPPEFIK
ncbi:MULTISPECIES: helix-turn-helix transcriptional regulator [unclassified Streptomyces]|uniref:helix-turn-helix transcriptional regulator n=1 Tax=unclassified Streptomyces TaxID=2593676 RepID=UPI0011CE6030|nr:MULTISPECIES: LuxR C-terminal-related transcriptional regulator [unclassified Streptomyces]TXS61248.1 LuxR family transcriptional regulator [Streptomyces sp. me109]